MRNIRAVVSHQGIFLLAVFLTAPLFADGQKHTFLDAGAYVTNINRRSQVPDNYVSKVSSMSGALRLRVGFPLSKTLLFEPSLGTLVPWKSEIDGTTREFTSHFLLNLAFEKKWFAVRLGSGIQWQLFQSTSGTVTLRNGQSSSDFYLPDRSVHAFLITAQAGVSLYFAKRWGLGVDAIATGLLSSERRRINGLLTLEFRL